jgi:hypothetical protein
MNVYVVMSDKEGKVDEHRIIEICLTEDIANDVVLNWKKSEVRFSRKNDYWIEDYELNVGNLNVFNDPDNGCIIIG